MKLLIGVVVSAVLLWLSLRDVDFGGAWAATQAIESAFEVGYQRGGYGRWTGRTRLMTWS